MAPREIGRCRLRGRCGRGRGSIGKPRRNETNESPLNCDVRKTCTTEDDE